MRKRISPAIRPPRSPEPPRQPPPEKPSRYWRAARALTLALLVAWSGATFGVLFFARELAGIAVLGAPFSFYMAAQGLTLFYAVLIAIYVFVMGRLDDTMKEDSDG